MYVFIICHCQEISGTACGVKGICARG